MGDEQGRASTQGAQRPRGVLIQQTEQIRFGNGNRENHVEYYCEGLFVLAWPEHVFRGPKRLTVTILKHDTQFHVLITAEGVRKATDQQPHYADLESDISRISVVFKYLFLFILLMCFMGKGETKFNKKQ